MAAASRPLLWNFSSIFFSTTLILLLVLCIRLSAGQTTGGINCNPSQPLYVKREDQGDIFTNICETVGSDGVRQCYENCTAKGADSMGRYMFDHMVEQCACTCRPSTHLYDIQRQVCVNTQPHAGPDQVCAMTVGTDLYQTLSIPSDGSPVYLEPITALRVNGTVKTQAMSCRVVGELYMSTVGLQPLNRVFDTTITSGPFFELNTDSAGYIYIWWRGPTGLSSCVEGLVIQLGITCDSGPTTCVMFKLEGTVMYGSHSGAPVCLHGSTMSSEGSGMGPIPTTNRTTVMTGRRSSIRLSTAAAARTTKSPPPPPTTNSQLAMIIGVAVGAVLALGVIGVSIAFLFYRAGKMAGRKRSTMRTNLPYHASSRKRSDGGVANPGFLSQAGHNGKSVPPPVPPRPGEEPNYYYSSAEPEDIYMELDGTQRRSLYRKPESQGGAYTSLNAGKGKEEPPAPPPVGTMPGHEAVYVEPEPGPGPVPPTPADHYSMDYEGYVNPQSDSEGNEYLDLNNVSSNL